MIVFQVYDQILNTIDAFFNKNGFKHSSKGNDKRGFKMNTYQKNYFSNKNNNGGVKNNNGQFFNKYNNSINPRRSMSRSNLSKSRSGSRYRSNSKNRVKERSDTNFNFQSNNRYQPRFNSSNNEVQLNSLNFNKSVNFRTDSILKKKFSPTMG